MIILESNIMTGAELILEERNRQIEVEGYDKEHDKNHDVDTFVKAAISYSIVDLDKEKMPPCMIIKSNGSTTYATRDLAAILYRTRTYDFDKCIYVTSYEQVLHFKQVFEVAKLLGIDEKYTNNLIP